MSRLTEEQRRAVERRDGSLMVRAGAGTGKTTVLVERFVLAVAEDGVPVEHILAITFTEKAAAEMKARVRRRFLELGRPADARAAEGAWISTIHAFCARLLRTHALSAGIDPRFRVLDQLESERLALDAFDAALEEFMGDGRDAQRVELVAAYGADRLRDMVRTAHGHLRSRGERRPRLEELAPPRPAGERERLDAAAAAALVELGAAPRSKTVERALEALEAREPLKGSAKALETPACDDYRDALAALKAFEGALEEQRNHAMLRVLLAVYDDRFGALKRERSGVDFGDLELIARDVLAGDPGLRDSYASRFEHVMVDEFQDTNPLQNELIELFARENLFRVGDENQSIYRFRHADVSLFAGHWDAARAAGRADSITVNFRSRGEILDAVDLCFERLWGERFEPLREAPAARAAAPPVDPCVELIVVERSRRRWQDALDPAADPFGAALHAAPPWRAAEARLLARRVDELTSAGPFAYRDVVVLFRATTAMGYFERALEERGIPVHVVGGRGYFSQQQVTDLRHWLAALANPLDGLALYSVLASPLGGVSLDAVTLIGLHARHAHAWRLVSDPSDELVAALPDADRRRLGDFAARFEDERRAVGQVSLETLIDRAVTRTGYDRHLLALPGGQRRMANVRKLMRIAREYEADRGRDLRGFIDSLGDRELLQSREGEAPLEAEAVDAVRMMTVHRAKGLEFPVVCVADLGKDGREDDGSLRISDDGSVGLRLARLGGGDVNSERLERIKAEAKTAAEAEERRVFYVAMTRAQRHLVLSGATELEKQPSELCEPMRWVWRGLCAELRETPATGVHVDSREGRDVRVRYTVCTPETVDEVLPAPDRAPASAPAAEERGFEQPPLELGAPPAPRALPVSRLSYSSLEAYRRCGYRFYLERALGFSSVEPPPPAAGEAALTGEEAGGITALQRGSVVHALIERLDFRRPRLPGNAELRAAIELEDVAPVPAAMDDLRAMLERLLSAPLRERIGRARRVRTELPFAFTLTPPGFGGRSVLVNGVVDVHAVEDAGTLVVDWKSDALDERDPEQVVGDAYSTQRLVYALAALRAGAERVEVLHCFLERPEEPASAVFGTADADRLEAELLGLAGGLVEGRFEPSTAPHYALCADCPGRAALCVHGEELTLREVPTDEPPGHSPNAPHRAGAGTSTRQPATSERPTS